MFLFFSTFDYEHYEHSYLIYDLLLHSFLLATILIVDTNR